MKQNREPLGRGEIFTSSTLVSRNVTILGRRTSVRLEPEMWTALKEISVRERCSIHELCSMIFARKQMNTSLTAAIRVFLMLYYRAATTEEGHIAANHGDFAAMRKRARFSIEDEKALKRDALFTQQRFRQKNFAE